MSEITNRNNVDSSSRFSKEIYEINKEYTGTTK